MSPENQSSNMPKTERVSSRLIKKERSKLVKQTMWMVGGGIVLVAAFIFLVLPNFFRLVNAVLNTNPIAEEEAVIIQAPDLVAPISATNSAELKVSGVGTSNMKTIIVVNGTPGPETTAGDDGSFSSSIELTEGENTLAAYSIDDNGNESKVGRSYTVILDTKKPSVEVLEPTEGQEFDSKQTLITVKGNADPDSKIYLNDRFFLPKADGSFSTNYSLNSGENILIIKVIDEGGNQVELERKVVRKS